MADTIGTGMVGRAIQGNMALEQQNIMANETRRSNRVREAFADRSQTEVERSNLVREGMAAEGLADTKRRTNLAEKAQTFHEGDQTLARQMQMDEAYLSQQPQWDKIADTYYAGVQDFDEQQADLLIKRKELEKNLSKTGIGTVQMASTAVIQKIELELEALEKSRTTFIDGFEDNERVMSALMKSSAGYTPSASPYALYQMSPEDSLMYTKGSKEQAAQLKKAREAQDQYEADIQARQLEAASKADSRGKAEGALPSQLTLQRDRLAVTAETANQKVLAKAVQEEYESDVKYSVGTIENTIRSMGKQINNILKISDAGEFALLGGSEGSFKTTATEYYIGRPAEFKHDMTLWNGFMGALADNHTDVNWMRQTFPTMLNAMAQGGETFSGLSNSGSVTNPLLPMIDALSILSKDAKFLKADASKKIGQIAISWQKKQEVAAPKPEATSLPSAQ